MLSTVLSTIALFFSLVSVLIAFRAVQFLQKRNSRSLSLARMAEVERTLTELLDAYNALLDSHKKLRSRIGMRATREKRTNGVGDDAIPVDEAGKAAYKQALRRKLKAEGLLK